jgi:hypothetical protein
LRDDGLASGACRRLDSIDSFLTYSGEFVGAIGLREFQNVFFDFGFVDQCVHGVFLFGFCVVAIGVECVEALLQCLGIYHCEKLSDLK